MYKWVANKIAQPKTRVFHSAEKLFRPKKKSIKLRACMCDRIYETIIYWDFPVLDVNKEERMKTLNHWEEEKKFAQTGQNNL